jgi:hypothetical protein
VPSDKNCKVKHTYIGQLHDEIIGLGFTGGKSDLFQGSVGVALSDVFGDCGIKKHWLLSHNSNLSSQPANVQILDVNAIQFNLDSNTSNVD